MSKSGDNGTQQELDGGPAYVNEETHYPDAEPDGLGVLKSIKRHPRMKVIAPNIQWGETYQSWPIKRRLHYAERLASTMNHAADVLQTECEQLRQTVLSLEEQLAQNLAQYAQQGDTMHTELGNADAEKQDLYQEIVRLKQQEKKKDRRIVQLEAEVATFVTPEASAE